MSTLLNRLQALGAGCIEPSLLKCWENMKPARARELVAAAIEQVSELPAQQVAFADAAAFKELLQAAMDTRARTLRCSSAVVNDASQRLACHFDATWLTLQYMGTMGNRPYKVGQSRDGIYVETQAFYQWAQANLKWLEKVKVTPPDLAKTYRPKEELDQFLAPALSLGATESELAVLRDYYQATKPRTLSLSFPGLQIEALCTELFKVFLRIRVAYELQLVENDLTKDPALHQHVMLEKCSMNLGHPALRELAPGAGKLPTRTRRTFDDLLWQIRRWDSASAAEQEQRLQDLIKNLKNEALAGA